MTTDDRRWLSDVVMLWAFLLSLTGFGLLMREHLGGLSYFLVGIPLILRGMHLFNRIQSSASTQEPIKLIR